MDNTATQAKQRWNDGHYAQVKVSVTPEIAASFKAACAKNGVSIAGVLSRFMADYGGQTLNCNKPAADNGYTTRRKRRAAVIDIISRLESIKAGEERLVANAPPNLQGAPMYETAEECVSLIDECIDILGSVY